MEQIITTHTKHYFMYSIFCIVAWA